MGQQPRGSWSCEERSYRTKKRQNLGRFKCYHTRQCQTAIKISGNRVKIANLLTLCGLKHAKQDVSLHKYKGRIAYRGDDIRDQDGCQVVFDPVETCTNPTALVALNITLFYGMMQNNSTSLADAIQAFLQAPLPEETWVVLGEELWLPERSTRPCVRLLKSLYGHPLAGKLWQSYLDERLAAMNAVELEGYPSNYFVQVGSKMLLLNLYVDDLTLSGDATLHLAIGRRCGNTSTLN